MIACRDRSVDLNGILLLGFGKDAYHDAGKGGGCGEKVEATDRSGGDFDAPSGWQEARSSRHRCISREWQRGWHDDGPRPHAVDRPSRAGAGRYSAGERHRKAPCGQSPTTPYVGRKNGSGSAGEIVGQSRWPIPVMCTVTRPRRFPPSAVPGPGAAQEPPRWAKRTRTRARTVTEPGASEASEVGRADGRAGGGR